MPILFRTNFKIHMVRNRNVTKIRNWYDGTSIQEDILWTTVNVP